MAISLERFLMRLDEKAQRTGAKLGNYPPLYTHSQYPPSYYLGYAADFITYYDIFIKNNKWVDPKDVHSVKYSTPLPD